MASTSQKLVCSSSLLPNLPTVTKADTASAPTIGTAEHLIGTYTIMMVDPDIPPQVAGGLTSELLHWMQSGLVSSNTTTAIGGMNVFELVNPGNTTPIASYIQPSPPNESPISHRYTQLLLNTTGNTSALSKLAKLGMTRTNFSAVNVVNSAGLTVLMGNSFNVTAATNTAALGSGNSTTSTAGTKTATTKAGGGAQSTVTSTSVVGASTTKGAGNGTATSSGAVVTSTSAAEQVKARSGGAIIAGLGAFAAMIDLL